jgi:hypothetical protein
MLIGIAGKAGSGKDELALYLKNVHGFSQLTFAEPIKDALAGLFDTDIHTLEKIGFKENPIPGIGKSLRELYQTLGTDWGRNMIDEDIWVRQLSNRLQYYAGVDVVVSDVRYENEAEFIRLNGGTVIHLHRHDAKSVRAHSSESGVMFQRDWDMLITNNSSLDVFYDRAAATLEAIRNEHPKSASHSAYQRQNGSPVSQRQAE